MDDDPYRAAAKLFGDNSILDRGNEKNSDKKIEKSVGRGFSNPENLEEKEVGYVGVCVNDLISMLDLNHDDRFKPDARSHIRKFAVLNYANENNGDDESTVNLPKSLVGSLAKIRKEIENYYRLYVSHER
jgi:hypothetical protein|tara:strand:+ start:816 stop:1205 length:390 start_codon:yes stop_codon:yes gene_type:complete